MELFALASLALVAGVVSFTAPCTLPLLPGYVAYISGMSDSEQTVPTSRVLLAAALFVAGFSAVFVALGVTASGLGLLLAQNGRLLELVGGVDHLSEAATHRARHTGEDARVDAVVWVGARQHVRRIELLVRSLLGCGGPEGARLGAHHKLPAVVLAVAGNHLRAGHL